jgi:hypothetical protein
VVVRRYPPNSLIPIEDTNILRLALFVFDDVILAVDSDLDRVLTESGKIRRVGQSKDESKRGDDDDPPAKRLPFPVIPSTRCWCVGMVNVNMSTMSRRLLFE